MTIATLPPNEAERLAALRGLKILDTPPEERFDRLTRLARRIFNVPYAVVSLVDSDRQWFKSASGMDLRETPRDISFCAHAILRDNMTVVRDALLDPRFAENPLVVGEPHIRFYAGMPLSGAGGERLGTLCLLDRNPRRFTAHDGQLLKNLAAMVEEELNLIELNKAITSLQESETNLEDFMENVGDLIMMATLGGTILYANRAWKERFGYDEADLQSLSLDEIFRRTPEQRDAIRARLQAGESIKGLQMECVAKDGRPFPVESTVSLRFKDGKPYYTRVIMRDVTERRKIEQLKSEAFALASHELRTPLTVMITTLSLIDKVKEGRLPPKLEEFLEMIRRNGDRLMDLVNKYLDVSKIESGDMEFDLKPVALAPAVERALEDIRAYGAQRGIRFEIKASLPGVKVRADPGRLDEVLTNLLSNAAKFSPADGLVSISLSRLDGVASIAVADHGPGIPKDFQARIFGKFARDQSDPQSPARKGTGLGLSIAKAIVEKMGGHIGFETEIEKGTTFSFSLPVLNDDADGTMI